MSQCTTAMSRFDIRIPAHVRETVEMAASLQGRSLTDFLVTAMLEKAEQVIADNKKIALTLRDQSMLAEALRQEIVEEACPFVQQIAREYTARVRSK